MPTKERDMLRTEYHAALARRGFTRMPYSAFQYWKVPTKRHDGGVAEVSALNAPKDTYRSKLAYLISQDKRQKQRNKRATNAT